MLRPERIVYPPSAWIDASDALRTRDGPGRGQSCKGAIGSGGESSEPQFAVPLIELTGSYPPQTEISPTRRCSSSGTRGSLGHKRFTAQASVLIHFSDGKGTQLGTA